MQENELLKKMNDLKSLQKTAAAALSPFTKAAIAEKAVSVSIDLLDELVKREVARNG